MKRAGCRCWGGCNAALAAAVVGLVLWTRSDGPGLLAPGRVPEHPLVARGRRERLMHTLDRARVRLCRKAIQDLLRLFGRCGELRVTVGTDPVGIRVSSEVAHTVLEATTHILVDPEAGQDARGQCRVALPRMAET